MIRTRAWFRAVPVLLATPLLAMLTGCMALETSTAGPVPMTGTALQGMVHGGEQPIVGAQIELFAAGSSGNGKGATALLTEPVFTGPGGSFSITGDYTCPSDSTELYLVALGGNPGLSDNVDNSAITLVTPVGQCGNIADNAGKFFVINEVTTVATAYALAGFVTPNNEMIGSTSTNDAGLQNAFATVNNLVDVHSGTALAETPEGQGIPPQDEINSLADALSSCVNTGSNESPQCTLLLSLIYDVQGNAPVDTFAMVIDIAQDPATVFDPDLISLAVPNPPFQPTLTEEPDDWSVAIVYSGGGLQYPYSLAIDGLGNIWVSSAPGYSNSLSELSPLGVPISPSPNGFNLGYNLVGPIAIDSKNNIWMPSVSGDDTSGVLEVNNNGEVISPGTSLFAEQDGFAAGKLYQPFAIAIDFDDNSWISEQTGVVAELDSAGNLISPSTVPSGFTTPGYFIGASRASSGAGIAIDIADNVWVANAGQDSLVELNQEGEFLTPVPEGVYGGGLDGVINGNTAPNEVAVDPFGDIFTLNTQAGTISEFGPTGTALSPEDGYTASGTPVAFCIDSNDRLYISQPTGNAIQVFFTSKPESNFDIFSPGLDVNAGIAVDASGNIWVANSGTGYHGAVTELVGLASPTKTPIAVANQTPSFAP